MVDSCGRDAFPNAPRTPQPDIVRFDIVRPVGGYNLLHGLHPISGIFSFVLHLELFTQNYAASRSLCFHQPGTGNIHTRAIHYIAQLVYSSQHSNQHKYDTNNDNYQCHPLRRTPSWLIRCGSRSFIRIRGHRPPWRARRYGFALHNREVPANPVSSHAMQSELAPHRIETNLSSYHN